MFGQAILRDTFDPTAVNAVNTRIVSRPPHQTGSRSAQIFRLKCIAILLLTVLHRENIFDVTFQRELANPLLAFSFNNLGAKSDWKLRRAAIVGVNVESCFVFCYDYLLKKKYLVTRILAGRKGN